LAEPEQEGHYRVMVIDRSTTIVGAAREREREREREGEVGRDECTA